jgi:large subunit ribosomal protein L1
MALHEDLKKALSELRKEKERKFDQTVDLIINLQKFEVKKTPINTFISVPHPTKKKNVAAFFESQNEKVDTITLEQFKSYSDKKKIKNLVKKYDFFIAQASLMPKVAQTFGRVLGPVGKMPSPQLGILMNVNDKSIDEVLDKINTNVRVRVKESSIKLSVGKQSMEDKDILENIETIYNAIEKLLPRKRENVKNVELKFTMTKPEKIQVR